MRPHLPDPRRIAAAGLLVLTAMLTAAAVRAQSDFPRELQVVDGVRFRGRHHVPAKTLLAVMKTRPPSSLPWRDRPVLRLDFLRADTIAIQNVYRQYGYLDASARASVRALREVGRAEVTFEIREGRRCTVREVRFEGVHAYGVPQLRQKVFTRRGHPFNPSALIVDTLRIAEAYQDRGYRPRVAADTLRRGLDVTVTYTVVEGPQYRFGGVYYSSSGPLSVRRSLIERELDMKPGDVYRSTRLQRTVERLYATDLFRSIQVTALPDSANRRIEVDMRIEERKRRWIDAGIGSGTSERFNVNGSWGHRNVFERGWSGSVGSRLSLDNNARFLLWRSELSGQTPWLIGTRTTGNATGYFEQSTDRISDPRWVVHQRIPGVRFQVQREFSRILRLTATQDNAFTTARATSVSGTLTDSSFHYATHLLNLALDRDTRDDPLTTLRGSMQSLSGEVAGGPLKGRSSYTKGQAVSAWYTPAGLTSVFAAQVRAGMAAPFGSTAQFSPTDVGLDPQVARVPLAYRFRLGGVNSVRGFEENSLAPSGGLAMFQANVEMRMTLVGPFGLEIFADAGNIWTGASRIHLGDFFPSTRTRTVRPEDVRYVFGFGPRLILPFGPLRLDFTWIPRRADLAGNLDPAQWWQPKRMKVQFAIGPSF